MSAQTIALIIFVLSYVIIASEKIPRQIVALVGALLLITIGIMDIPKAVTFVNWETMGLLFGMFLLMEILARGGFFDWLALELAELVHYRITALFIIFPLAAGFLSMFMDSITVMLFFSSLTVSVARAFKVNPIPMVIAEVVAANTGGAATLVGDPPNVILGTMLGFGFTDFALNNGPIILLDLVVSVAIAFWMDRRHLARAPRLSQQQLEAEGLVKHFEDPQLVKVGLAGLVVAVGLLVIHKELSAWTGLSISAASAAALPALIVLALTREKAGAILKGIDWESLLFFLGLFILVGGLETTGTIRTLSDWMVQVAGGNGLRLVLILLWVGAILSAVIDNVPMALTMAYVLKDIAGLPGHPALATMVWALSMGIDMGGNGTPIGASANVVAYAVLERRGYKTGWGKWMAKAIPPTLVALGLSSIYLWVRYF